MIKQENINPRVQKALFRRIEAVNKLKLKGTNQNREKFFEIGNVFDVQDDTNPIEQEYFRTPWARVSIAVPNVNTDSDVIHQMINVSSYLNTESQNQYIGALDYNNKEKNGTTNYIQGYNESENNRFRGHSGITSISATQKEFYTHGYTIEWNCPDPVYFDQVFEPAFLKLGATILMEFGYGREYEKGIKIPQLTLEDIKDLLNPEKSKVSTRERNLIAPQNYFCAIGTVHKFDWKIDTSGGYSGNLQVISMGINPLSETSEPGDESDRPIDNRIQNIIQLNTIGKQLLETGVKSDDFGEKEIESIISSTSDNYNSVQTLLKSGVSFKSVIKNLDKAIDKYLDMNTTEYPGQIYYQNPNLNKTFGFTRGQSLLPFLENKPTETPIIDYKFKDGVMYFNFETGVSKNDDFEENEKLKGKYLISWGWFEDIILNSFFELKAGDSVIQQVRSVDESGDQNLCKSNDYLYTLGLDSVILPGKTHNLLTSPLDNMSESDLEKIFNSYEDKTLRELDVIRSIYQLIDEKFNKFETEVIGARKDAFEKIGEDEFGDLIIFSEDYIENPENYETKTGIIRNMVFPIEMYQKHFESTTSLRQSMQSFWSDVSGMYSGYWRFALGQEQTSDNGKIGISELGLVDTLNPDELDNETQLSEIKTSNQEQLDKLKKCFKFSISSQDSIVKEFDISLDISAEAATLARYGSFKSQGTNKKKPSTLSDVSIEAWNILQQKESTDVSEKQKGTLELYKKFKELEGSVLKDIKYPSDDGIGKSYVSPDYGSNRKARNLGDDGIEWDLVDQIKEDLKQQIEKIDENTIKHYKGIGIYNGSGNMSSYFKQTMLYLLRTAKIKGVESSIKGQVPIPVTISMSLDGIGGLKVGDIFKIDYLPKSYRDFCYFVIKKVDQKITTSGWNTDIEAYMQFNGKSYFDKNPQRELSIEEESIKKLFEYTDLSVEEISKNLSPDGQKKLDDMISGFNTGIAELEKLKQEYDNTDPNKVTRNIGTGMKQKPDMAVLLRNIEAKLGSIGSSKNEIEKTLIDIKVKNQINESYSKAFKETANWLSNTKIPAGAGAGYYTTKQFFGSLQDTWWIPIKKPTEEKITYVRCYDKRVIHPSQRFKLFGRQQTVDEVEGWLVGNDRIQSKKLLEKRGGAFGY